MEVIKFKITGVSPLLMHAATLCNPLDPITSAHKALTGKKKKTDEDQRAIQRSEYMASIYFDKKVGVYLPGVSVEGCIVGAAKMQRLGVVAKRSLLVLEDKIPLEYAGPETVEKLYADVDFVDVRPVRVMSSKVMRCRPKFTEWSATFTVSFNPEQVEERDIIKMVDDAGSLIGVGDFRPRFGRFSSEVINA